MQMSFLLNIRSSPPLRRRRPQMQIDFEDRKLYDVGNDCLMTIDGTELRQTYRHDIRRHGEVFRVIAIMTQLAISNGSPLFKVEYAD